MEQQEGTSSGRWEGGGAAGMIYGRGGFRSTGWLDLRDLVLLGCAPVGGCLSQAGSPANPSGWERPQACPPRSGAVQGKARAWVAWRLKLTALQPQDRESELGGTLEAIWTRGLLGKEGKLRPRWEGDWPPGHCPLLWKALWPSAAPQGRSEPGPSDPTPAC